MTEGVLLILSVRLKLKDLPLIRSHPHTEFEDLNANYIAFSVKVEDHPWLDFFRFHDLRLIEMKAKVQIYLEEEQDRQLERLARLRRVSKSQLIRESLSRYLEELVPAEEDPALEIIGLAGKVGLRDLSQEHDAYLTHFRRLR